MSDRTNYFPNPRGRSWLMQPAELIDATFMAWSDAQPGFALKNKTTTLGAYARFRLTLPAGSKLVLLSQAGAASESDTYRGAVIEISDSSGNILAKTADYASKQLLRLEFTVPADGAIDVKFRGKAGEETVTAFYFTSIVSAGEDEAFFDMETQPIIHFQ